MGDEAHVAFAREEVWIDGKDSQIIEKVMEQFTEENTRGIPNSRALSSIDVDRIKDFVVGPEHMAFLLDDNHIIRVGFQCTKVKEAARAAEGGTLGESAPSSASLSTIPPPSALHQATRSSGSKFRRVMLAANRSYCRLRTTGDSRSVIIDRGRPMMPASAVPEELVNQAQAVLQGKSREVIIRELQRTSLNVNEAVNNLLSRDDDDDDGDFSGDVVLPEELLQLLDASSNATSAAHTAGAAAYLDDVGEALDYISHSSAAREIAMFRSQSRKKEKSKKKDVNLFKNSFHLMENIEWWTGKHGEGIPEEAEGFDIVKIACTSYELFALDSKGCLYGWKWADRRGSKNTPVNIDRLLATNSKAGRSDIISHLATSNIRIGLATTEGLVLSWLDENAIGRRAAQTTLVKGSVSVPDMASSFEIAVSDYLFTVRQRNLIQWGGLVPLVDRIKMYEKEKAKAGKKQVSFNANSSDLIVEGSTVQTKALAMYPAGSVALFIDTTAPMVGVLVSDAWSTNARCHFRVLSPAEYDEEGLKITIVKRDCTSESSGDVEPQIAIAIPGSLNSRKRRAAGSPTEQRREEVWGCDEVIWIHEHRKHDTAVVKILDGNYVGVEYIANSCDMTYASQLSEGIADDSKIRCDATPKAEKMRLMRKDELVLYTPKSQSLRTPKVFQRDMQKFSIDPNRRVISIVADLSGFRILARRGNDLLLCHATISGKVVSERKVPVSSNSMYFRENRNLSLFSFGDARTLFLRDEQNSLVPLVRDAVNGYREPPHMNAPPIRFLASCSRPVDPIFVATKRGSVWEGSVACIFGTNSEAHKKTFGNEPTLLQLVLSADYMGVLDSLNSLVKLKNEGMLDDEGIRAVLHEQVAKMSSDGAANLLHAAVHLSVAERNAGNADNAPIVQVTPPIPPLTMASAPGQSSSDPMQQYQQPLQQPPQHQHQHQQQSSAIGASADGQPQQEQGRWETVLRGRARRSDGSSGGMPPAPTGREIEPGESPIIPASKEFDESSTRSANRRTRQKSPEEKPYLDAGQRQANAIKIVEMLLEHPVFRSDDAGVLDRKYDDPLYCMLAGCDVNGMTPFMLAVHLRSYRVACSIWKAIKSIYLNPLTRMVNMAFVFPDFHSPINPDNSPLFLLCYNDTCSFTWTGEDHINQDIYECRTCGLTGSLCCCSECALTCHRNHDCKLKRTSPTAYCDCWEKCACKALIAGNEKKREELLMELLTHTPLYTKVNGRGEHVILFLSRTIIRQSREQSCVGPRSKRRQFPTERDASAIQVPEHDLPPPKFAKFAMEACLRKFSVLKSAINIGNKEVALDNSCSRDNFYLLVQSGATHIDKLTFTMLNKSLEKYVHMAVETLNREGKLQPMQREQFPDFEQVAERFMKSIVRVLAMCINVSPIAASAILTGKTPETTSLSSRDEQKIRLMHAIALSGFLPVVKRDSQTSKAEKANSIAGVVVRALETLREMPVISALVVCRMCDVISAPLRYGLVHEAINPAVIANQDPMEVLEKYFMSESSLEHAIAKLKATVEAEANSKSRRRKRSRRETDRDEERPDSEEEQENEANDVDDGTSESADGIDRQVPERSRRTSRSASGNGAVGGAAVDLSANDDGESTDHDDDDDDQDDDDDSDGTGQQPLVRFLAADEEDMDFEDGNGDVWFEPQSPDDDDDDDNVGDSGAAINQGENSDNAGSQPSTGDDRAADDAGNENDNVGGAENREFAAEGNADAAPAAAQEDLRVFDDETDFFNHQHGEAARIGQQGLAGRSSTSHSSAYRNRGNNWASSTTSAARTRVYSRFGRRSTIARPPATATSSDNSASSSGAADGGVRQGIAATAAPAEANQTAANVDVGANGTDRERARDRLERDRERDRLRDAASSNPATSSSALKSPKPAADELTSKPSKMQAQVQLAFTYAMLMRVACDLKALVSLNSFDRSLKIDMHCDLLLKETLNWGKMMLDHMESMLRFNFALRFKGHTQAGMPHVRRSNSTEKKPGDETDVSAARRETLAYLMSVMRGGTDDHGDGPIGIDYSALVMHALILDAVLIYQNTKGQHLEDWKTILDQFDEADRRNKEHHNNVDPDVVRRFFKRTNSLTYAGDEEQGVWHMVGEKWDRPIDEQIPVIKRPDMLRADVARREIFSPHFSATSRPMVEFEQNLLLQGVRRPQVASLGYSASASVCPNAVVKSCLRVYYGTSEQVDEAQSHHWRHTTTCNEEMTYPCPDGLAPLSLASMRASAIKMARTEEQNFYNRWSCLVEAIGVAAYADVATMLGNDAAAKHSPLMASITRFGVRYDLFTKLTEKYRSSQNKDAPMELQVHRDPMQLIVDLMSQMNAIYQRRAGGRNVVDPIAPLASTKLRVRFADEPGEGTGVTRSFYTALAEVCATLKTSPFDGISKSTEAYVLAGSQYTNEAESQNKRARSRIERSARLRLLIDRQRRDFPLKADSPTFVVTSAQPPAAVSESLYADLNGLHSKLLGTGRSVEFVNRVVGILGCSLPAEEVHNIATNDETLWIYLEDCYNLLRTNSEKIDEFAAVQPTVPMVVAPDGGNVGEYVVAAPDATVAAGPPLPAPTEEKEATRDDVPLFQPTPRPGFITPAIGNGSNLRLLAFRNIGRVLGICLMQGDIFPLRLSRHVFKYILQRPITWFDLAFYDRALFESLRMIICRDNTAATFEQMDISFSIYDKKTGQMTELKPGGNNIEVTQDNAVEYVYRYADHQLLGPNTPALEALRDGVLEVVPENLLWGLTAEDLHLILCGSDEVCVSTLQANTVFLDESRAPFDVLAKFKQWFWQVIESLSMQERQDLLFFWTGTPTLPPSGDWPTNATVMLRPADDNYLPTANTCISRLYVPVYSSKKILRNKIILATKAKNFGFV